MAANEYLDLFNSVGTPPMSKSDWEKWVSASKTMNYLRQDPILDWLNLYGSSHGFLKDTELHSYDSRTDFKRFIFEQGRRFETAVVRHIRSTCEVETVATNPGKIMSLESAAKTFELMREGIPIIHQGVLLDPPSKTYGAPDLLVRSDHLAEVFPDAIDGEVEDGEAPDIGALRWYYLIVDLKFTTLKLVKSGELGDAESNPSYKAQLFIYNRALGWAQGRTPEHSFLLGRGWTQNKQRGSNCMERLAPVKQNGTTQGRQIGELADDATHWIREVRLHGDSWEVLPEPTRQELYPNMGNNQDSPWGTAKKSIAHELDELTLLWQVGVGKRIASHQSGITSWRDPECTVEELGVAGPKQGPMLQALLDVNQDAEGLPVRPERIQSVDDDWRTIPPLEFYVDFETVTDLADDFSNLPKRGGQPLIFMIGCGYLDDGNWQFECFVADLINETSEARIIDQWLAYMDRVAERMSVEAATAPVIHWAPAESSSFEKAYNSAKNRQPAKSWPNINWFDFLNRVVKAEPVVVNGALKFGLKEFAKALHSHGLIDANWEDSPLDGMGAMVGAWWCHEEAQQRAVLLREITLMQDIIKYNEVDCRAMMETVQYLRENH